jgi:hypothetical protein
MKKLASAGSLDALKKLIAEFYATGAERITLTEKGDYWSVQSGEKPVTPVVAKVGKRFVFGMRVPA